MDTQMGRIAQALSDTGEGRVPLQRRLDELGTVLSKLVLGICVVLFLFELIQAGETTVESVLSTFMVDVSLAVAAIPEGLATVVTVVLSIGVANMSRRSAVIRRLRLHPGGSRGVPGGPAPGGAGLPGGGGGQVPPAPMGARAGPLTGQKTSPRPLERKRGGFFSG